MHIQINAKMHALQTKSMYLITQDVLIWYHILCCESKTYNDKVIYEQLKPNKKRIKVKKQTPKKK